MVYGCQKKSFLIVHTDQNVPPFCRGCHQSKGSAPDRGGDRWDPPEGSPRERSGYRFFRRPDFWRSPPPPPPEVQNRSLVRPPPRLTSGLPPVSPWVLAGRHLGACTSRPFVGGWPKPAWQQRDCPPRRHRPRPAHAAAADGAVRVPVG